MSWEHLEQSETTMMEEAQAAATRFRCSGTRGAALHSKRNRIDSLQLEPLELLDPLSCIAAPVTHATMLGPDMI